MLRKSYQTKLTSWIKRGESNEDTLYFVRFCRISNSTMLEVIEREKNSEHRENLQRTRQSKTFLGNCNQNVFKKYISSSKNGLCIIRGILIGHCPLRCLNTLNIVQAEEEEERRKNSVRWYSPKLLNFTKL